MHYDERKPDRSRHVGVKVHFLRDLARDGHMKLVKFAGTYNVSDGLTKSLSRPAFEKHRVYMIATAVLEYLSRPISTPIRTSFRFVLVELKGVISLSHRTILRCVNTNDLEDVNLFIQKQPSVY
jgi:hypothetical protein